MAMEILKKKKDFQRVYRRGHSVACGALVLYLSRNRGQGRRFGFSVSKKTGKAVVRNRVRRVLREICRLNEDWFPHDHDVVIIARREAVGKNFHDLAGQLYNLARRAVRKMTSKG
ncbi:ribonuclease P protein component [Desulfofundulus salinus]|uniref:Ribonuclease P protein component n=1 Tax=Desulfofundulus salinus TaxID=2419843 RepID=A0A494WTV8_9FIRM|nr:ribonuclease P protein component [Desulfofundulus salinum]